MHVRAADVHCIMPAVQRPVQRGNVSAATLGAIVASIVLGAIPYAARSDWSVGTEAALRHDSNVGNAQTASEIVADYTANARLSLIRLFPLDEGYSVTVGGDLSGESFRTLTGLNNASLEGGLSLKRKWGLGAFAPWARAGISVGRTNYDDSYRNAWAYRAALTSGRRIERWNLWAEYAFERRAATPQTPEDPDISGDAYSQTSHLIGANLEYSLNDHTFLTIGLLVRHGDVVSTAGEETGAGAKFYRAARALAKDPAFGAEDYAYKLTGTTYGCRLGINYSPTEHSLLGLGFERLDTHADGGNRYTKSIPEITWVYRF